jgi:hypothetical protein
MIAKEIIRRIRQSVKNRCLVDGSWKEKFLYYLNFKSFCTDNCNFNNKCVRIKDKKGTCEWCGANQDLEGKVRFGDYKIGKKIYLVDNGGGGHGHPAFEIIGVFSEKTEALGLLCDKKWWGITEMDLNKVIYKYIVN